MVGGPTFKTLYSPLLLLKEFKPLPTEEIGFYKLLPSKDSPFYAFLIFFSRKAWTCLVNSILLRTLPRINWWCASKFLYYIRHYSLLNLITKKNRVETIRSNFYLLYFETFSSTILPDCQPPTEGGAYLR